jgi:hypothetical protein
LSTAKDLLDGISKNLGLKERIVKMMDAIDFMFLQFACSHDVEQNMSKRFKNALAINEVKAEQGFETVGIAEHVI